MTVAVGGAQRGAGSEFSLDEEGIFTRGKGFVHRQEEYDEKGFEILLNMQREHFWYLGRHRLVLQTLRRELEEDGRGKLSAIDLGGGCGGWLEFLYRHMPDRFSELALGDSSLKALRLAGPIIGSFADRYRIDVSDPGWEGRWDVIFLLDVLEHLAEDADVLVRVARCLKPQGRLIVTSPALHFFWSYNDNLVQHKRRYSIQDFQQLALKSGLRLKEARYFMFLLSPLLYLSRLYGANWHEMTPEQVSAHLERTHRVPPPAVNGPLKAIFSLEVALAARLRFPWGTSILGIFEQQH